MRIIQILTRLLASRASYLLPNVKFTPATYLKLF